MTFKASDNIMELIWDNLPKMKDGVRVKFTEGDLELIWWNGFVDTVRFSLKAWTDAFEPHKQPNKTYILTKADFLEKDHLRYDGEIRIPFDPILINEGMYTEEGLQELIDQSIAPSCVKTKKELQEFFEAFKNKYSDGKLIRIEMSGKREIAKLLFDHPSPLRRLELMFDAMFSQEVINAVAQNMDFSASPDQAARVQVSAFSTLPSNRSEKLAKELKSIERARKERASTTSSGDEGIEIKKVKKSRKGFKG